MPGAVAAFAALAAPLAANHPKDFDTLRFRVLYYGEDGKPELLSELALRASDRSFTVERKVNGQSSGKRMHYLDVAELGELKDTFSTDFRGALIPLASLAALHTRWPQAQAARGSAGLRGGQDGRRNVITYDVYC
jgi:hypothetical protein